MQSSKVIEVDGVFVGAAVRLPEPQGWRFVSTDARASGADGAMAPTYAEAQMLARRAIFGSRVAIRPGEGGDEINKVAAIMPVAN